MTAAPQQALDRGPDRPGFVLAVLAMLLIAGAWLSLSAGYTYYAPAEVWRAMTAPEGSQADQIILSLRLPRIILALLVGAGLGIAGLLTQTLTRNGIASPEILGLNAGAAFAVVVASLWFGIDSFIGLSSVAAAGAAATSIAVFAVATAGGGLTPIRTVLVGFTFAGLLTALTQIVLTTDEATLENLLFWLAGSFTGRPADLPIIGAVFLAAGTAMALAVARSLDVLVTDEDTARSLGTRVPLVRCAAFLAIVALTGGAVALAGPIGFVGLMVPHLARGLGFVGHRALIAASGLLGALFCLFSDIGARFVLFPQEAPVGAVTALIGGPFLVMLLRRRAT